MVYIEELVIVDELGFGGVVIGRLTHSTVATVSSKLFVEKRALIERRLYTCTILCTHTISET